MKQMSLIQPTCTYLDKNDKRHDLHDLLFLPPLLGDVLSFSRDLCARQHALAHDPGRRHHHQTRRRCIRLCRKRVQT